MGNTFARLVQYFSVQSSMFSKLSGPAEIILLQEATPLWLHNVHPSETASVWRLIQLTSIRKVLSILLDDKFNFTVFLKRICFCKVIIYFTETALWPVSFRAALYWVFLHFFILIFCSQTDQESCLSWRSTLVRFLTPVATPLWKLTCTPRKVAFSLHYPL